MRRSRVLLAVQFSVFVGLALACGGFGRNGPRPDTGAATPEELVAAYRRAHEAGDPEQLRQIDLAQALLPEWGPFPGDYAAELRRLFRLRLTEVRFVPAPPGAADLGLYYLSRKPDGESGKPKPRRASVPTHEAWTPLLSCLPKSLPHLKAGRRRD